MPRAMAVIGFTFFFSLWFFGENPGIAVQVAAVASAVGFAVSMLIPSVRRKSVMPVVFLTIMSASVLFGIQYNLVYKTALSAEGEDVSVKGVICDLPYVNNYGRNCCEIETISIDGVSYKTKMLLSSKEKFDADPCDILTFKANVYVRGGEKAVIRERLMSGGVWLGAYPKGDVTVERGSRGLRYYTLLIRRFTEQAINESLPERQSSVLIALLLGNTSYMDDDLYDASQKSGILHIFAVSGFNLSLLSMSVYTFLEKKKLPEFLKLTLPALLVLLIMSVTGFSRSCVRAGIMLLTFFVGRLFSQRTDSLNSLGMSALLICFFDPFAATSIGFLMSLFASGAVITVSPVIASKVLPVIKSGFRPLDAILGYILSTFLISLAVTFCLLPVTIHYFDGISTVAPLVNCFIIFASEWALVLGFLGVLFSGIGFLSFIPRLLFLLSGLLCEYIAQTAEFFGEFGFSFISIDYTQLKVWLIISLFASSVIFLMRTSVRKCTVYSVAVSGISLLFTVILLVTGEKDAVRLTAIPSENTPCVAVTYDDTCIVIGNIGEYDEMQNILSVTGVTADVLIVPDVGNNSMVQSLVRNTDIKEIVVPKKSREILPLTFYAPLTVAEKYSLTVSDRLSVKYSHSDTGSAVLVTANGKKILMVFAPGTDMASLPKEWQSADILYTVSDVPFGVECNRFGYIILSAEEERGRIISEQARSDGAVMDYTGNKGIILTVADDGLCRVEKRQIQ
ncbi:MAG: ComEC/Rec2 family competence protein [Clostridia bacterium]|nr:ComEC/Rec2 family competence protein [Clostridia bacterium]